MTGSLAALVGSKGSGAGYTGSPGAVTWANISGFNSGSNGVQTMSGITGSMSVTITNSGLGTVYYTLAGVTKPYAGAFAWANGQTLSWTIVNGGTSTEAGTITVTNATASTTLATFTYSVKYTAGSNL
ncbi:MAG TPA: hypothetical protein VG248_02740 [Caulobacteraceae bacterium]|jgi:hypothetical protein|nr:hypothetical protein [Caulobacteraceae bacterium]